MNVAKHIAVHASIGNAPANGATNTTAGASPPRIFSGVGSPASALNAGNGRFNASTSGWVYSASLTNGGSGYVVGDVLTVSSGTTISGATVMQITVDAVVSGVITDWHTSQAGGYSFYPGNPASTTGGSGSGATFTLNYPQPDFYIDVTTITAPVLWVCTVAGSNSGSTWQIVSGSGGGGLMQFKIVKDCGDFWYCYTWDGTTVGTIGYVVIKPYKMRCGSNAIGSETIRGVTYTYTYALVTSGVDANNLYYVRTNSFSSTSETNYPEPCPIITTTPANNEIITANSGTTNFLASIESSVIKAAVVSGGSGYSAGTTLTVSGGTLFSATGISFTAATIYIDSVDGSGAVTACHIVNASCYSTLPSNPVSVTSGSATFNLTPCPQLLDTDNSREWAK